VLWVHSALSPTPEPPEPVLVTRWIEALRRSEDPRLRELGIRVRPHPERLKEWNDVSLAGYENVAFHGGNPITRDAKNDYFDSLYYSSAVIGLVTSAFLEAAIVGRPVLTFTLPEYRLHQEEMIHFRYLLEVEGGLLHVAPDLATHFEQLAAAVALEGARDERNRRFLAAFIRPGGLESPATPAVADAIERLRDQSPYEDGAQTVSGPLRTLAVTAASWSRVGIGRWLMNDRITDERDAHAIRTNRSLQARRSAKDARIRAKVRRQRLIQLRDAVLLKAKAVKSEMRAARYRAAMFAHRMLGTKH
jgi:hypothetical protein